VKRSKVDEETKVNAEEQARLIAAAPEMFDALDELLRVAEARFVTDTFVPNDVVRDAINAAGTALAKADGRLFEPVRS
jgi:monomeric isocitrate dehydrogenase